MASLLKALAADEAGFIVSAELILVAAVLLLTLVVGLAELAYAVNLELGDLAQSVATVNSDFSEQPSLASGSDSVVPEIWTD